MLELRTQRSLQLCFTPLYRLNQSDFKICHLNARSLHKHINDVRKDFNFISCDVATFTESRFSPHDDDKMYAIHGFLLFRNDDLMSNQNNRRPYHGRAVYSKLPFVEDTLTVTILMVLNLLLSRLPVTNISTLSRYIVLHKFL